MKTVSERLKQMLEDMKRLVPELNRDGLYADATRCQVLVENLDDFIEKLHVPDVATWPPKVTKDERGETHWRVTK